jgi:ABC-2 type transport system permease protein
MNNQMMHVAKWEFMHFFKWKQEIISKLIMIAIALVVFFWQSAANFTASDYRVAVASDVNFEMTLEGYAFSQKNASQTELKSALGAGEFDALLLIDESKSPVKIEFTSKGKMAWQQTLQNALKQHYATKVSDQLSLSPNQMLLLTNPITLSTEYLDHTIKNEENHSSSTAIGVLVLLSVGIFMSFAQVFVSITGEKQQRVTEQLYATMSAQTWVDGKILGQVLLALKAMLSTIISVMLGVAFMQVIIEGQAFDLSFIDWALLPWVLAFALLGLYFSTAFMAAIAAAIDDPNHSGKSSFMMIPLIPMILAFMLMDSPSGWVMTFLSYFPLTAFAVMPVKMALVDVANWQPILSLILTFALCVYMRGIAGRLFKMGMVMYGKEPSFKQMLGWAISER